MKLQIVEYIPKELLSDDLYKKVSKGSRVILIKDKGILVERWEKSRWY